MTVASAVLAVQRAIFGTLTGDPELMARVSGVFDEVPEDAEFPYVVIGEATSTPRNTLTGHGRETVVTLHVWSRYQGFTEALEIADRITGLLDHQPLEVPGHTHIATRFEFSETLRDSDPRIRHVPLQFRVVTEQ